MSIKADLPFSIVRTVRYALRLVGVAAANLLVLALVATLAAQLVRDRAIWLALLMFVPIWPLAAIAIASDLLLRGRTLSPRWLLLAVGIIAGAVAIALMWTPARAPEGDTSQRQLKLIQWNTQWGGPHGQSSADEIVATLHARGADIICLSEAPYHPRLKRDFRRLNPGWSFATVEDLADDYYWYRLTVLSRYPVRTSSEWDLPTGHAVLFEIDQPSQPLRILMVDLQSGPLLPRSQSLRAVARIVSDYAAAHTPLDLVLGDFNTPARFIGFDALAAAGEGYERAALWSGQWRSTWPSKLPLSSYDIDHVWVRRGIKIAGSEIFGSRATDHRGQEALLRLP